MNDEMRLDPDKLRQHSARLAELGDRMGQSHAGLRDSLTRAEGCWGDDHLGMAFAKDFKPQADQLLAGLQAMEESLRSTASGIVDTVRDFEAQDLGAADRIQEAAEVPDSRQLDNSTATNPSGNTEPLSATDRAVTPPAPTESSSSPGGPRTSDASSRPRSPEGPQRSNPSAGQPGPSGGPHRADNSGRRPSSSSVSPRATTGDHRPGPPGVPRTREANPSVDAGRRQTQPGGRSSAATGKPGAAEPARPNSRYDAPPRMPKQAEQPSTGGARRRSEQRKAGNPGDAAVLGWLARMLTEKHGVEVIGFDAPGLDVSVMREFVAAVDRVLSDYPVVTLDVVLVADLDDNAGVVQWNPHDGDAVRWNPHDAGVLQWKPQDAGDTGEGDAGSVGRNPEPRSAAAPRPTRSVTLGRRTAQQPRPDAAVTESQTEQLQVYVVTVAELGRALDFAGDGVARWKAQRTLIAEYLHREVRLGSTLAEVVHGYQRWRGQLTGDTGDRGFDVDAALGAAFAEVVVRGDEASVPAVALHELLVATAAPAR